MDFNGYIVSAVIFAPLLGALMLAFIPSTEKGQIEVATLFTMLGTFGLSLWMYFAFDDGPRGARVPADAEEGLGGALWPGLLASAWTAWR